MRKYVTRIPYGKRFANTTQSWFTGILFLLALILANTYSTSAAIIIQNISKTESTCGNNGTATITATSSKADPFLIYELIAGPSTAPLQNNSTFSSLFPGTYTVRVYDIDFAYKDASFTITGNYTLPDMLPVTINPMCPGFADGIIKGNAVTGTGKAPFTWELLSPVTTAPQPNDSFKLLTEGTYMIRMTDACFNVQTRTAVLVGGGTGLSHWYDGIPSVEKLGCDTVAFSMQIRLFKEKASMPLKLTVNTTNGTRTTYVYPIEMDITNYVPGFFIIRDTIPGVTYSSYLYACLTDTCGKSICATKNTTSPFEFDIEYSTIVNCGNKLGATLRMKNPPYYNYIYTTHQAPLKIILKDVATNTMVDSSVCDYSYCALTISPQIAGRTYDLTVTDGCGAIYKKRIVWPVLAPPRVEVYAGPGCLDSTSIAYFNIWNFTSSVKVTLLSGPSTVHSSKPHYEFSDVITYPKTFTPNAFNGLAIKNLVAGTYTYRVEDTCGNMLTGSLTVLPRDLSDFNYSYKVRKGCLGDNMLYFDARSSMTVGVYLKNAGTGEILYQRRGFDSVDSIPSLTPGKYVLIIFYGFDYIYMGGGGYDGVVTNGNYDCWGMYDTLTILPYSSNVFQAATSIFCNGTSYVQLKVDSARGVSPYQYEIVSGPKTFPYQNSNVFQLPTYGTYIIRIKDACGNSNTRQISVDSAKFPPVIKKGASCSGSRIVLKGVSSSFFSYEWKRPNGSIYTGDSLVIASLSPADTGIYIITKKVTINGCTDSFRSTYHVTLKDEFRQVIPYCTGTAVHVGTHIYTLPGIYTDTLTNTLGCDSIIYTSILVLPQKADTSRFSICKGDHITIGTNQYTTTGIYKDSVQNAGGCYDLIITDLKVNGTPDTTKAIICQGSGRASANKLYYHTGIYTDTLVSSLGCDSIIVLNLTVLPYKKDSLVQTICAGKGFIMNGRTYTSTGIYRDTLPTIGCDSIVILNLTVSPLKKDSLVRTICEGKSTTAAGKTFTQTGIYTTVLSTATCDSTVILNLTVLPYKRNAFSQSICSDQAYTFGTHSYHTAGIYTDTISTIGCDSIVTLTLTVHPVPHTDLGKDTSLCTGQSITLEAGTGFTSYAWNDGLPSTTQHTLTVKQANQYWVHITDQNGCKASDTIRIPTVYALPVADAGQNDSICKGATHILTASGGVHYVWMPGGIQQASIQVAPSTTTIYTVTVTDNHFCSSTASVQVALYPSPSQSAFAGPSVEHCFQDGPMELKAQYGNSFLWIPSGETTQSIEVTQEGIYTVQIWDTFHCVVSGEVTVSNYCEAALYVPSGFSPNGDGVHDDLEIFGRNFTDFDITIFNRWGEIIFVSDERNNRWDGMYRGEEMPIGSYPWIIHYKSIYDTEHKEQTLKGSITLVR